MLCNLRFASRTLRARLHPQALSLAHARNASFNSSITSAFVSRDDVVGSSSAANLTSNPSTLDDPLAEAPADPSDEENEVLQEYGDWLEDEGIKFKRLEKKLWLGQHRPFPMNQSFLPPPPLSHTTRRHIHSLWLEDPESNSVRALSQRFHLSLKRVEAILRLMNQEREWLSGKPLQTGFQVTMDYVLDATTPKETRVVDSARYDVFEADALEESERRDQTRQRYQRMYWESVTEDGKEPIVPEVLEKAVQTAKVYAQKADQFKATSKFMPEVEHRSFARAPPPHRVERMDGSALVFVDVGGKFLNVDERLHRIANSQRRSVMRARRRLEKAAS